MTPEQEDVEKLLQAIKLKRYEQPPPRYFNEFSSQVISRIRSEARTSVRAGSEANQSVVDRILAFLQLHPVVPVGLAAAVAVTLLAAIVAAERARMPMASESPAVNAQPQLATPMPEPKAFKNWDFASSTNPLAPNSGSLFDTLTAQGLSLQPETVSGEPPGNN